MTTTHSLADLGDRPLLETAKRLATEERHATVALLRALSEIDSRRLYLGEGCASMFTYCTQVLHLSEGGAYNRIEACRAARRYPVIFELIESSALTLTAVRLLAPHLTDENHRAVLESARHRSQTGGGGTRGRAHAEAGCAHRCATAGRGASAVIAAICLHAGHTDHGRRPGVG
jgi:hypothetical protein